MRSPWDGLAQSRRWGTGGLHRILTPLRRHAGALVVSGLVLVLIAMVAIGTGLHPRTAQALDGGAWLGSANGALVHANGTSARVDWVLDTTPGDYQVIQQGAGGLVDDARGQAQTIDGSSMSLSKPTLLGSGRPQLVAGGGHAYVVYQSTGVVQPVDPTTLVSTAPALRLGDPVGSAAVDGSGVLFAVITPSGTIDTIEGGSIEAQVTGGSSSGRLVTVGPRVVEVDARTDSLISLSADGTASSVGLGLPPDADLAVPATAATAPFWITDTSSGAVLRLEPGHGVTDQVPVGADGRSLGAPQADAGHVYLEDSATGAMLTVDLRTRATAHQAVFPAGAGVALFPKDGLVWGNDFEGSRAVVTDGHGSIQVIDKYADDHSRAPRPTHKPTHKPAARPHKAKKTPRKGKRPKPKRVKTHKVTPTPTTATTSPATTSTLPTCATTTTTTPPSSTSSTSSSTTSTTAPCRPGTTTTTTCPPPTTTTTQPGTTSTSSTTTTEAGATTTTDPCQPTTTTSTTSTTTPAPTSTIP